MFLSAWLLQEFTAMDFSGTEVFEMTAESLNTYYDQLGGTLGETLLAPTKIYVKALKAVKEQA